MLYLSVLTVFSCVMMWDLRRMHKKRGDCCCWCCSERLCCGGRYLSDRQKKFSGIFDELKAEEANETQEEEDPDAEKRDIYAIERSLAV